MDSKSKCMSTPCRRFSLRGVRKLPNGVEQHMLFMQYRCDSYPFGGSMSVLLVADSKTLKPVALAGPTPLVLHVGMRPWFTLRRLWWAVKTWVKSRLT